MLYYVRYDLLGLVTGSYFGFCFFIHINCTWIAGTFHVKSIISHFSLFLEFLVVLKSFGKNTNNAYHQTVTNLIRNLLCLCINSCYHISEQWPGEGALPCS